MKTNEKSINIDRDLGFDDQDGEHVEENTQSLEPQGDDSKIYITIYSLIISFSAQMWRKIGCALCKPFWPPLKAKNKKLLYHIFFGFFY